MRDLRYDLQVLHMLPLIIYFARLNFHVSSTEHLLRGFIVLAELQLGVVCACVEP